LTVVQAYLPDGAEFGPLNAARPWHRTKHSLRLRQEILRLRRQRRLRFTEADDPVRVFFDYKRKEVTKRRSRTPHRTAEAARTLNAVPASPQPAPDEAPSSEMSNPTVLPVAKPRQLLHIGKGQVMKRGPA
jgi:putative transposase